jgi:hypothetical protein
MMSFVFINTGFAAVLRVSAQEVGDLQRAEVIEMTARMITTWLDA